MHPDYCYLVKVENISVNCFMHSTSWQKWRGTYMIFGNLKIRRYNTEKHELSHVTHRTAPATIFFNSSMKDKPIINNGCVFYILLGGGSLLWKKTWFSNVTQFKQEALCNPQYCTWTTRFDIRYIYDLPCPVLHQS